jgi:hypothetical protein
MDWKSHKHNYKRGISWILLKTDERNGNSGVCLQQYHSEFSLDDELLEVLVRKSMAGKT